MAASSHTSAKRRELAQEAEIVLEEQAHVVDAEFHQAGALDDDAESEALVFFGIVFDRAHHVRMDHSAAQHLGPSRMLADRASGAVAQEASDIEFRARLGERKVARAKAHRGRSEKRARELGEAAFEMRHRDWPAMVNHEAF